MTSSRQVRWIGVALGACVLLVAGCTSGGASEQTFRDPALASGEFTLVSFDSCDEAGRQLRAAALAHVGTRGAGDSGMEMFEGDDAAGDGEAAAGRAAPAEPGLAEEAAPAPAADPRAPDHSGTNVHESGVDEPDLVKTDGRRIVTVSQGVLRVVDPQRKVETGRLDVRPAGSGTEDAGWWQPADLLLHGDRALVLFDEGWWGGEPMPVEPDRADSDRADSDQEGGAVDTRPVPVTGPRLVLVDLAGSPRVISEYTVDGGLVDARATGGTARVVVRSAPRIAVPEPRGAVDEAARLALNRQAIQSATLEDWLPRYQVSTAGRTATGQVDCTAMSRPETYSGTSMLTVLTFDLAAPGLGGGAPISVVADGDTVYSNGTSLYVASDQRWRVMPQEGGVDGIVAPEPPSELDNRTEIFKFDTTDPGPPRFAASGSVPGALLNQYAMSEWEGYLRVATTTGAFSDGEQSSSAVYVLAERDGELAETGSVGGLGETERIYSVRFTGPVGYVVTFRETDPLYTLDLRDPAAPAVLGELKITGYSAYLHPLGDGRLVGIGQEANENGQALGTQVSLFDVSDLANPERLGTHHVESGHSEAEFDPHAFLWWPEQRLLVVPMVRWSPEREQPDAGALVLRVEDEGFTALDVITHPTPSAGDHSSEIRRSLVIGDTLWTISDLGLQANALSTLEETGWVPL